jgi:hypothetical protein
VRKIVGEQPADPVTLESFTEPDRTRVFDGLAEAA